MKKNNKVIIGCGLILLGLIGFCQFMSQSETASPAHTISPMEAFQTVASSYTEDNTTISSSEKTPAVTPTATPSPTATPTPVSTATLTPSPTATPTPTPEPPSFDLSMVQAYSGNAYTEVNGNEPFFRDADLTTNSFENYSSLDSLGRCGVAYACVGQDLMPTEERGEIGMIKPSGWQTVRYDDLIADKYLYNRCHLIGYQLTGENANEKNLITGTRYMNIEGMLPFENKVADYAQSTGNHVLYRVTPVFEGENLLAAGVLMEAMSAEDAGAGLEFCVFAYNVQPYIDIDYSTGANARSADAPTPTPEPTSTPKPKQEPPAEETTPVSSGADYIGNKNSKKFHYPSCSSVDDMKESNKYYYSGSRDGIINQGYKPCKRCDP